MRRVDQQIERARRDAYAQDPTTTSGIAHNTILEYINDGQDTLQSIISAAYSQFNIVEDIQNCVNAQEAYTMTNRVFLNNRFVSVELSSTGNARDYVTLTSPGWLRRDNNPGLPCHYIRRDATILLNPIPDSATYKLRVNHEGELDDLDIRRARVAGVTGAGTSGSPLTAISLESSAPTPDETDTTLADIDVGDYICVVDKDGNRVARNIPVTAGSASSITVDSFELATGDTLPAAGDYVVFGKYKTTHSGLPDRCDNHLVLYTTWRILAHKGSTKVSDMYARMVVESESKINKAYSSMGTELMLIPQLGDYIE